MEVFRTNFEEEQNLQTKRILAENNYVISAALSSTVAYLRKIPESKKENVERTADKQWWTNGFEKWDNDAFKHRIRVSRERFTLLLVRPSKALHRKRTNQYDSISDRSAPTTWPHIVSTCPWCFL